MAIQPPDDPLLLELIDRALAPYRALLPEQTLATMRAEMADAIATYPYPSALLRKLQPPPVVQESNTVPIRQGATNGSAGSNGAPSHGAVVPFAVGRGRGGGR
jgi:hypothetical protein